MVGGRRVSAAGQVRTQIRSFGTLTGELLAVVDWLVEESVTHAARESTGGYWKPLVHLREGRVQVILVNAQHITPGPGRKTEAKDCEWRARLLQHGRLKASLVPPRPTPERRDRTRQRTPLVRRAAAVAHRIQKVLEDANLKLGSVASEVLGESGRDLLRALIAGETDPDQRAEWARKRRRATIPAWRLALPGRVSDQHRFLLRLQWDQLQSLEDLIGRLHARIEEALASWAEAVELLPTIPGVSQRVAETVVAEIGTPREQFPTAAHLASWAGLCPGNDESAGTRRSGRTTTGSRWRRGMLVPAAGAASHTKDSDLAAQDRRLARRKGRKRALIAVGQTLLVISYHVVNKGLPYHDLGGDYLDRLEPERLTRQLVRRLEQLGHQVTLNAQPI